MSVIVEEPFELGEAKNMIKTSELDKPNNRSDIDMLNMKNSYTLSFLVNLLNSRISTMFKTTTMKPRVNVKTIRSNSPLAKG